MEWRFLEFFRTIQGFFNEGEGDFVSELGLKHPQLIGSSIEG